MKHSLDGLELENYNLKIIMEKEKKRKLSEIPQM